jgi:hypothetical protein
MRHVHPRGTFEGVFESLTGVGLATAAGLNAYIPLLALGLLSRFTGLVTLPAGWQWLESPFVLAILAVLLAIEFVADKIPVVDHINDVVQTFVRPTAGGLAFGAASSSQTVTVNDPSDFFSQHTWVPLLVGAGISLVVHVIKATVRPVVNASTVGVGAPVASTAEDAASITLALTAIVLPILIIVMVIALAVLFILLLRWRRRRREEKELLRRARAMGVM